MNKKNTLGTLVIGAVAALIGCTSTRELEFERKAQAVASIDGPPVQADSRIYSSTAGRVVIAEIDKATEQQYITEQSFLQITMSKKNNPNNSIMELYDYGIDGTCDVGRFYGNEDNTPLSYSRLSETGMENEQFFQRQYEKALNCMLWFGRK